MSIGLTAVGSYVPPDIVNNDTISAWTGKDPHWIVQRTGYIERRYSPPDTTTSELAYHAVQDLLVQCPDALDHLIAVVLATSTPDKPQPATAVILKNRLGLGPIPAFDINAVCAGWLYGLRIGAALAEQPGAEGDVLVVAADMYSRIMDRADPTTVTIFGDGAGVGLLRHVPDGFGILSRRLRADAEHHDLVQVAAGGTAQPLTAEALAAGKHLFRMKGRLVREYVLDALPKLINAALDDASVTIDQIDRFIFHQANLELLRELAEMLGADPARLATTPHYGNAGAASVVVALSHSHQTRPIKRGELLLVAGVGGGMTSGAYVVRWW